MSRARPNNARMTRQVPATATFEGRPDRVDDTVQKTGGLLLDKAPSLR